MKLFADRLTRLRPKPDPVARVALTAGLAAALMIAVMPSAAPADARSRADRRAAEKAAWVPEGEPVSCIDRARLRETRVLDDQTIDFIMTNGARFRNSLPNRCPQLGFSEAFSYQTSLNQLCNVDLITVIQAPGPNVPGASCGLGTFQPVKRAERPAKR